MNWQEFYAEPVSMERYIRNVSSHSTFLLEIMRTQPKDRRLLEVGCGSGVLSIHLSRLGYEVVSIDNNDGVLAIARDNDVALNGRVTFIKADAYSLPFRDNFFQVCFSQGFFEHFDDRVVCKLLREQLRVARTVLFSVPTLWYPQRDFGNERLMEREDWLRILLGFKVEKGVYYRHARPATLAPGGARHRWPQEGCPLEMYFKIRGSSGS